MITTCATGNMLTMCGLCEDTHQSTHWCIDCQLSMCAMLADVHTKMKATQSHKMQEIAIPTADIQSKIDKALGELQQTRSDMFVQYANALPPRNVTSPAAEQRASNLFAAFIDMGVRLTQQHERLVGMQKSLPSMNLNDLISVAASPLFTPDTTSLQRYIASLPPYLGGNHANDMAVSLTGEVYVCDAFNHRVQVFSPAGEFLRMWSLPAQPETHATAICVAAWGDVYLIQKPHLVSQFKPDGSLVRTWHDDSPIDLATDDNQVYVLNNKNGVRKSAHAGAHAIVRASVRVYSSEGELLDVWHANGDALSLCTGPGQHVYVITPAACHIFGEAGKNMAAWGGLVGAKKARIHGSEIYVVEKTGVRVFLSSGALVRALGHSKAPRAVAVYGKRAYIGESHSIEIVDL